MNVLLILSGLFFIHAIFDPNIVAYRDMRRIKKALGVKRIALKPLIKKVIAQNDKTILRSANRVIIVDLTQILVLKLVLLLMFERCYINSFLLSGLGTCEPNEYNHYLLFAWLGFMALMLYTLWETLKLRKQVRQAIDNHRTT